MSLVSSKSKPIKSYKRANHGAEINEDLIRAAVHDVLTILASQSQRSPDPDFMNFKVGTATYLARISPSKIFNDSGEELWGLTDYKNCEIVLSPDLPVWDRDLTLRHEFWHVACRYFSNPGDEESGAMMFAAMSEIFEDQFSRQGGERALTRMRPRTGAESFTRPRHTKNKSKIR
jgi:hypothetical protein